jgi:soluble lytic murein transglycosylase
MKPCWKTVGRLLLAAVLIIGGWLGYRFWEDRLERSQDVPIQLAAHKYGVPPALVKAVVWRESHFNPNVHGRAGELGLMQLMELTAQEWAEAEHITNFQHLQCLDPATNTMAGSWYLRKLLRRYQQTDNPLAYALADYNAGRGNVLKWKTGPAATNSSAFIEQISFPGTQTYVRTTLRRFEHYRVYFR